MRSASSMTYLFDAALVQQVASSEHAMLTVDDVHRHIGLCFDACHMAVEFEDPAGALERLMAAGIRVCKVQISSALRVRSRGSLRRCAPSMPFAEDTYLHQVVERSRAGVTRYVDLPEAMRAARATAVDSGEWRVHFHVPIFLAAMQRVRARRSRIWRPRSKP